MGETEESGDSTESIEVFVLEASMGSSKMLEDGQWETVELPVVKPVDFVVSPKAEARSEVIVELVTAADAAEDSVEGSLEDP